MVAMTSIHAEKCFHLESEYEASPPTPMQQCTPVSDLQYIRTCSN